MIKRRLVSLLLLVCLLVCGQALVWAKEGDSSREVAEITKAAMVQDDSPKATENVTAWEPTAIKEGKSKADETKLAGLGEAEGDVLEAREMVIAENGKAEGGEAGLKEVGTDEGEEPEKTEKEKRKEAREKERAEKLQKQREQAAEIYRIQSYRFQNYKVRIGISWGDAADESRKACIEAVKAAGAEPVLLDEVVLTAEGKKLGELQKSDVSLSRGAVRRLLKNLEHSNAAEVMRGVDAVIFCGKDELSPTLFDCPVRNKRRYNARADVSDVLLLGWCLKENVPVLGISRGMGLIGALYGAELIEDIEGYYKNFKLDGRGAHANGTGTAVHDVEIKGMNNQLYEIANGAFLPSVPSDHNRALRLGRGNRLKVTGVSLVNRAELIEAVEVPGKSFALGIAFNPELSVAMALQKLDTQYRFLPYNRAIRFFTYLKQAGLQGKINRVCREEMAKAREFEEDMREELEEELKKEKEEELREKAELEELEEEELKEKAEEELKEKSGEKLKDKENRELAGEPENKLKSEKVTGETEKYRAEVDDGNGNREKVSGEPGALAAERQGDNRASGVSAAKG